MARICCTCMREAEYICPQLEMCLESSFGGGCLGEALQGVVDEAAEKLSELGSLGIALRHRILLATPSMAELIAASPTVRTELLEQRHEDMENERMQHMSMDDLYGTRPELVGPR